MRETHGGTPRLLQPGHGSQNFCKVATRSALRAGTAGGCIQPPETELYVLGHPDRTWGLGMGSSPMGCRRGAELYPHALRGARVPGCGPAKHLCMRLTLSAGAIPLISLGRLTRLRTWLVWDESAQREAGPRPTSLMTLRRCSADVSPGEALRCRHPPASGPNPLFHEPPNLAVGALGARHCWRGPG